MWFTVTYLKTNLDVHRFVYSYRLEVICYAFYIANTH